MVKELNAKDLDLSLKDPSKPLVVEFWHDQCIWCKKLAPVFEDTEKDYPNAIFAKLNILANEENSALGERYGIMGTPTTKVFCGGRPVGEIIGFKQKADFEAELGSILQGSGECLQNSTPVG